MPTSFQYSPASNPFSAKAIGLALSIGATCSHGDPAVGLSFFGRYRADIIGQEERLNVVVPRCAVADIIGTLMATVRTQEGHAAADALANDIDVATAKANAMLHELHADGRDCCEAGFRSHGREHTCRREADRE